MNSFRRITDTTEILVDGDSSWSFVGTLPVAVQGIKAVNINNEIFTVGTKLKTTTTILVTIFSRWTKAIYSICKLFCFKI